MKTYMVGTAAVSVNKDILQRPKIGTASRGLKSVSASVLGSLAVLSLVAIAQATVHAQNNVATPYEAAAAYNAFNQNFLVQSGGNTYYNSELNSVGQNDTGGYGEANTIVIAEDNYDVSPSPAAQSLVINLLNTFESSSGTNWSGDTWNDDLGWMVNAYLRGYQITGNTSYLSIAEENWNTAYSRGWDSTLGGGIYENMANKQDKLCLSNDNFAWEGVWLYEATGNSTYLTDAENIYAWVRTHLFNPTNSTNAVGAPGAFVQGEEENGSLETPGDWTYNAGSFLEAAVALYQITGNSMYYNDAVLDINHRMSVEPILSNNGEGGGQQYAYFFVKALSDFATLNNLWSTYYPYMLANANQAWQERCSLDLTWNQWTAATSPSGTDAMEMSSAAGIWQLLNVPQQYQIINKNSGLAMDLISGNDANNAPIEQWGPSGGDANQDWSVITTPDGNTAFISGQSGMAATISGGSKQSLATLVDWPYAVGNTSLEFKLISEGGGWYEIQNVNSGLVLDDDANGKSNGTSIIQYPASGAANQLWEFVPVQSFAGEFAIQNATTDNVLGVYQSSTTAGAAVDQYTYNGGKNQLWTFVPTSMGYYEIVNVNSGQQLNVVANSYSNGADICQWPGGNQPADQWKPVQNSNGTWTFFNLQSGLALDDDNTSAQGAQFIQWQGSFGNGNQQFILISE